MRAVTGFLIAAFLAGAAAGGVVATHDASADEDDTIPARVVEEGLLSQHVEERDGNGVGSLEEHPQLRRIARVWSQQMAADDDLAHNPSLASAVHGDWQRLGENVGFTRRTGLDAGMAADRLHRAFVDSPGHYQNIVGDYSQIGVGAHTDGNTAWVTVVFADAENLPTFADLDPSHPHYGAVRAIDDEAITLGTKGGAAFGPHRSLTRAEMASFLARALELDGQQHGFTDVGDSSHAEAIGALAAEGITEGTGDGSTFEPHRSLTRAEMASFLARALELG